MQKVILERKGLKKEDLKNSQAHPVTRFKQQAEAKKIKLKSLIEKRDEIFEDCVTEYFPYQKDKLLGKQTITLKDEATIPSNNDELQLASGDVRYKNFL